MSQSVASWDTCLQFAASGPQVRNQEVPEQEGATEDRMSDSRNTKRKWRQRRWRGGGGVLAGGADKT